MVVGFTTTV